MNMEQMLSDLHFQLLQPRGVMLKCQNQGWKDTGILSTNFGMHQDLHLCMLHQKIQRLIMINCPLLRNGYFQDVLIHLYLSNRALKIINLMRLHLQFINLYGMSSVTGLLKLPSLHFMKKRVCQEEIVQEVCFQKFYMTLLLCFILLCLLLQRRYTAFCLEHKDLL